MSTLESPKSNETARKEGSKSRRSLLAPSWMDSSNLRGAGLAELERQRDGMRKGRPPKRYLTWPERQRLLDAPGAPVWPMLVAIGMLCFVSMSLTPDHESALLKIAQEPIEVPFVPHEAEIQSEQPIERAKERDLDSDSEEEANVLLLQKKREYISKDEGDKALDWVEERTSLGEAMLKGEEIQELLTQAPEDLVILMESITRQERDLRRLSHDHHTLAILLQQDMAAAAKLILLCRILAAKGDLSEKQVTRLRNLLGLVAKRFGEEWSRAISLTRYVADERERIVFLRLVSLVASTVKATVQYVLSESKSEGSESLKRARERLLWKVTTGRFEIQRLLEEAKLSIDVSEIFSVN